MPQSLARERAAKVQHRRTRHVERAAPVHEQRRCGHEARRIGRSHSAPIAPAVAALVPNQVRHHVRRVVH